MSGRDVVLSTVRSWLAEDKRLLVDGRLVGASRPPVPTDDPSTGDVVASVPRAGADDVEAAVEAAGAAQRGWQQLGVAGRGRVLRDLGVVVEDHVEELAMLDAIGSGNPFGAMVDDIGRSIPQFTAWPAVAAMIGGDTIPAHPQQLHFTEHQPYGVVARITAYNHPAYFCIKSMLPPLVMGNTVVLKPSEQAPLSALRLGELAADILPPGVLAILTGDRVTGDALVRHPAVKRIGFTGSAATGRGVQRSAADAGVKHVSLELGGKNAMVVLPDAPVEMVADAVVRGMNLTSCQGQSCGSTSRVFAHHHVYADLVAAVQARLEAIEIGPAYEPSTQMGPLVSAAHRERVADCIKSGVRQGARLVTGGSERPRGLPLGHYVRPTLFERVDQSMRIATEEIFGPVIAIFEWRALSSVVDAVNSVPYGLTSSIWTNDLAQALRLSREIQAGYTWVNDVSTHFWGLPFGGVKESGLGREECVDELRSYGEVRSVSVRGPWSGLDA